MLSLIQTLCALLSFAAVVLYVRTRAQRRSISYIRGPPKPSWLLGHQRVLRHQTETGSLEFKWFREYGNVIRIHEAYNEPALFVADPKALQYVFMTSSYHFPKSLDVLKLQTEGFGKGILSAEGREDHSRHRKVMLPAFSTPQLRAFQGIFQQWGARLCQKWKDEIANGTSVFNVSSWLTKTTLDVIGESAFEYKFNALEGGNSELYKAMRAMFADGSSLLCPSNFEFLYRPLWRYLPDPILSILDRFPTGIVKSFRKFMRVANRIGRDILSEKEAEEALNDTSNKDALSVLIRANLAEDPSKKLSDEEVIGQLATLLFAGHDTTASTMTWMLWELSKHPGYQTKIREEISSLRAKKAEQGGPQELTPADYDALVHLNAGIKETLRFHPIVPTLIRVASREDVIPLSEPITTLDGRVITEIPISKGQSILTSICTYNRLMSVWGEDAETWNPDRFLDNRLEKQVSIGVTANLMTFSAGMKACIGWRFALMEMQAIMTELVGAFEFGLPDKDIEIQRVPVGLMVPMIKGKLKEGAQMPLRISPVGSAA